MHALLCCATFHAKVKIIKLIRSLISSCCWLLTHTHTTTQTPYWGLCLRLIGSCIEYRHSFQFNSQFENDIHKCAWAYAKWENKWPFQLFRLFSAVFRSISVKCGIWENRFECIHSHRFCLLDSMRCLFIFFSVSNKYGRRKSMPQKNHTLYFYLLCVRVCTGRVLAKILPENIRVCHIRKLYWHLHSRLWWQNESVFMTRTDTQLRFDCHNLTNGSLHAYGLAVFEYW